MIADGSLPVGRTMTTHWTTNVLSSNTSTTVAARWVDSTVGVQICNAYSCKELSLPEGSSVVHMYHTKLTPRANKRETTVAQKRNADIISADRACSVVQTWIVLALMRNHRGSKARSLSSY